MTGILKGKKQQHALPSPRALILDTKIGREKKSRQNLEINRERRSPAFS